MIRVNQIGYRPSDPKYAVAPALLAGKQFNIVDETGAVAFQGVFEPAMHDAATDSDVCRGCFTAMTAEGVWHLEADKLQSNPFAIRKQVYDAVYTAAFRMLYLQRCGTALPERYAGVFAHPVCHCTSARIWKADRHLDVSGGWHDAGDYGRYVVPGAKTVADLLLLHRLCSDRPLVASQAMCLPESGNGTPDLLNEARYELDWMLRMQDPMTGGVYHKVTCASFPPFVMPQEETGELVLAPISDAATADFCAVMYLAAVHYLPYDAAFAEACLSAAERGWQYLMQRGQLEGYINPPELRTGTYSDAHVEDELFWAAACRVRCLRDAADDAQTQDIITRQLAQQPHPGLGWANMDGYALFELADTLQLTAAKAIILDAAEALLIRQASDGYGVTLGVFYPWGSNMTAANHGMLLLLADHLQPDERYRTGAHGLLDYLLGLNGPDVCYVSGFGTRPMAHPHHRPSGAIGHAMPGMLSGGPNMHTQDEHARRTVGGQPPALCFDDHMFSYSTNEIAIYWNSPLIFLLGAI